MDETNILLDSQPAMVNHHHCQCEGRRKRRCCFIGLVLLFTILVSYLVILCTFCHHGGGSFLRNNHLINSPVLINNYNIVVDKDGISSEIQFSKFSEDEEESLILVVLKKKLQTDYPGTYRPDYDSTTEPPGYWWDTTNGPTETPMWDESRRQQDRYNRNYIKIMPAEQQAVPYDESRN